MSVSADQTSAINPDEVRATKRDWAGLIVLAFAVLLIAVDGTVLDLALPFISADLEPSSTQLLWIIDVYSFVLAGLLITMGTLGDRIGRRKLLLIGAVGFGLASIIAALAVSPEMLIAARVLQGISGATLMPATLGLIRTIFVNPRQRTEAIGVWGAMAGGGTAAGPLVGGWLLEHFWWGSVFLINIPVMIALIVLGPILIPESKDPNPGRFDLISAGLSMATMLPLVYAVKESVVHGVSITLLVIGLVGLAAGYVFVRRQRMLKDPMLDLKLFANASFSTAVITNLLSIFALAGVLFFGSQYLQLVLGNSAARRRPADAPGYVAQRIHRGCGGLVDSPVVGVSRAQRRPRGCRYRCCDAARPRGRQRPVDVRDRLRSGRCRCRCRTDPDVGSCGQFGGTRACRRCVRGVGDCVRTRYRARCGDPGQRRDGDLPQGNRHVHARSRSGARCAGHPRRCAAGGDVPTW